MLADTQILNLAKVSLETKDLLPEYTGIYYVVDEKNTVWYIGKARNIRKRWQGKAHHRIYQLQNQKQNYCSSHHVIVLFLINKVQLFISCQSFYKLFACLQIVIDSWI